MRRTTIAAIARRQVPVLVLAASCVTTLAAESFELLPGAVVDADRQAILVMQPDSGIAVLDAASGEERCTTRHAARPLLVQGSRVLAQTESGGSTLRLYVLELERYADGNCRLVPLQEVKVSLPTHVVTAIDERIDSAFGVRAWADTASGAWVEWSYRKSPAFPDSFAEKGVFHVDLSTGAVEPARGSTVDPGPLSRALPPVRTSPREIRLGSDVVSITVAGRTDGTRSVRLTRRSAQTGKKGRSTELDAGDVRALRLASNDRSLLVSSIAPGAPPQERYVWSIYALETGRKQTELRAGRSGAPFYVADSVVVYREDRTTARGNNKAWLDRPVRLVAQSVSGDGTIVWSYRIRDTAYRGVRAPQQPFRGAR